MELMGTHNRLGKTGLGQIQRQPYPAALADVVVPSQ